MKKEERTAPVGVSQGKVQVTGRHGWGHQEGGGGGARTRVRRSSQGGKQGRQGDGGGSTRTLCPSAAAVVVAMDLNFAVILRHMSTQMYWHVLPAAAVVAIDLNLAVILRHLSAQMYWQCVACSCCVHNGLKLRCYCASPVRITVLAMCCLQLSVVLLGHGGRHAAHPHIIGLPFVGGRRTAVPCSRLTRQVRVGRQWLG